jgi:hypothetical protein
LFASLLGVRRVFLNFRRVILDAGISRISKYSKPSHASPLWMSETALKTQIKPAATRKPWAKLFKDPM